MYEFLNSSFGVSRYEFFWLCIGMLGQLLFFGRFIIQWMSSEKAGKSIIPVSFWYFSLSGSIFLLAYSIYRVDPIFILGFSLNMIIYLRNLALIKKEREA